ncbi:MAG: anthranilate phosphoribosyltransferase [Fimbriimonadaceae bacterium]
MEFRQALQALVRREDLSGPEAESLMGYLIQGEATEAQIAGALVALAVKGATAEELAAFARLLRKHALVVESSQANLIDTCGTGGGIPSFNLSTAAAIVASAAGVPVAKHGNRAVTSACGSADVLEALGVRLTADPEAAAHILSTVGIVFLFAPAYHPALKAIGKVRRELQVRTVFNQLGPLLNPAGAKRQLIGVFDPSLLMPTAEALARLDTEHGFVVCGEDGLDEVSPCGPTRVVEVRDGKLTETTLRPEDFGRRAVPAEAIAPGADVAENAQILREAIRDPDSPRSHAILPGAAMAVYLGGNADTFADAARMAEFAIRSGAASRKLDALIEATAGV